MFSAHTTSRFTAFALLAAAAQCFVIGAHAQGAAPGGTLVGSQTSDDVARNARLEDEIARLRAEKQAAAKPAPVAAKRLDQIKLTVKAAQDLIPLKKYLEALGRLSEFDAVADKTAEETYLIERTRITIAAQLNDESLLVKSLEAAMGSSATPAAERVEFSDALVRKTFNQKNYAKTITWAARYFSEGGKDTAIRRAQVLAWYLTGDYARARQEVGSDVLSEEAAGQVPPEEQLKLLVSCAQKLDDKVALNSAQQKYARYYPKK